MQHPPHIFPTSKSTVKQDVNVASMRCVKIQIASVHKVSLATQLLAAQRPPMENYLQTKVSENYVTRNQSYEILGF